MLGLHRWGIHSNAFLFLQLHISISPKNVKLNIDCQEVAEKEIKEANNVSTDGYEVLGKMAKSGGSRKQSATVSTDCSFPSVHQKLWTRTKWLIQGIYPAVPFVPLYSIKCSSSHPFMPERIRFCLYCSSKHRWVHVGRFFYFRVPRSMQAICNIRLCSHFSLPQFQLQMFDIVCSLGWTSRDKCCDIPAMVSRDCVWIIILRGGFLSTVWSVRWRLSVKAHTTRAEKKSLRFADFKRCL